MNILNFCVIESKIWWHRLGTLVKEGKWWLGQANLSIGTCFGYIKIIQGFRTPLSSQFSMLTLELSNTFIQMIKDWRHYFANLLTELILVQVERERSLLNSKLVEFDNFLRNPYRAPSYSGPATQSSFPVASQSPFSQNFPAKAPPLVSSFSQLGSSLNIRSVIKGKNK